MCGASKRGDRRAIPTGTRSEERRGGWDGPERASGTFESGGVRRVCYNMRSTILPTTFSDTAQAIIPRRYLKSAIYLLCVLGTLTTISFSGIAWDDLAARSWSPFTQKPLEYNDTRGSLDDFPDYPTDYRRWHIIEEALPQHNRSLSFPEGKEGRYVYFSEHVKSASFASNL